ncbi:ABC transporter permease [Aeromicrobium sp. A1-2]|uniref:ABC transporter permease n=1 Tax=Aeromicrobium sp. A1-2 TaxID=2107713 RepID=UPI000E49DD60|nr:ABC transporter permease [Aeromicrobium sp. A1-2]AXT85319.1 ABC transporter permease [Aeromicrobium sp. A1-2]
MGGLPFFEYLKTFRSELIFDSQQHILLSVQVLACAAVLGLGIAILTYRSTIFSNAAVNFSSVLFTLPSIALFGLMVPITGLGLATAFPILVLYALLPIIRNAVVGLQSVDADMVDAARGLGMARSRILLQIELPIAWPVILTGIRVAGQLTVGLVVIAAYVRGPGLGTGILHALSALGSVNTFNEALAGTLLVVLLALALDLVFVLVRRLTTPRGLRV